MVRLYKMKNSTPLFEYTYIITVSCFTFVPKIGKFPCSDVMSVYFRYKGVKLRTRESSFGQTLSKKRIYFEAITAFFEIKSLLNR